MLRLASLPALAPHGAIARLAQTIPVLHGRERLRPVLAQRGQSSARAGLPTRAHTTTLSACRPAAHNGGNRRSLRVTRKRLRGCWRRRPRARRQRRLRKGRAGRDRVGRRLCRRFRPGQADGSSQFEAQKRKSRAMQRRDSVGRGAVGSIPGHALHEKGLQKQISVVTLVSRHKRRSSRSR